jgi:citronellol/citronellal dehydrogenase
MSEAYRSPLAPDANEDLVALVTGGGTGLGRAIAREYARTGARVVIAGRRAEPLEEVASELAAAGAQVLSVPGTDVREPAQVASLVDTVLDRFGTIDVLVNNAGGQFVATPEQISAKGWRAVHRLNVDAVWDLTRTVAELSMIPRGGGLVVFIGFSPRRGIPLMVHASAARRRWRTWRAGSRSSGAATGSARCASRRGRSTPTRFAPTATSSSRRRCARRRSVASRRPRRWPA